MEAERKTWTIERVLGVLQFVIAIYNFDSADVNKVIVSVMLCLLGVTLLMSGVRSGALRQVRRISGYVGVVLSAVIIVKVLVFD